MHTYDLCDNDITLETGRGENILRFASTRSEGYKTFFMLNSAEHEHENFSVNKYKNANSWHFHIY